MNTHYFRINIKGTGYALLSKSLNGEVEQHPLAITSNGIPQEYIRIQDNIDKAFESPFIFLTLALLKEPGKPPMIAYGCKVNAKDEFGRIGLYFIHCIRLSNVHQLSTTVLQMVKLLSITSIDDLFQKISSVAIGNLPPEEFINYLTNKIETGISVDGTTISEKQQKIDFTAVRHDCSGAAPIAWLTFSSFLNGNDTSWGMSDTYSIVDTNTVTELVYNGIAHKAINASELLAGRIQINNNEQISVNALGSIKGATILQNNNEETTTDRREHNEQSKMPPQTVSKSELQKNTPSVENNSIQSNTNDPVFARETHASKGKTILPMDNEKMSAKSIDPTPDNYIKKNKLSSANNDNINTSGENSVELQPKDERKRNAHKPIKNTIKRNIIIVSFFSLMIVLNVITINKVFDYRNLYLKVYADNDSIKKRYDSLTTKINSPKTPSKTPKVSQVAKPNEEGTNIIDSLLNEEVDYLLKIKNKIFYIPNEAGESIDSVATLLGVTVDTVIKWNGNDITDRNIIKTKASILVRE